MRVDLVVGDTNGNHSPPKNNSLVKQKICTLRKNSDIMRLIKIIAAGLLLIGCSGQPTAKRATTNSETAKLKIELPNGNSSVSGQTIALKIAADNNIMGRNVTTEEIGNAAAFLLSDLASGITGEITYVDCGYSVNALSAEGA